MCWNGVLMPPPPHTSHPWSTADDEGSPLYGEDSGSVRRHFTHGAPSADRRQPTVGPRPPSHGGAPTANGVLGKRARVEYDTPDLPSHADRKQWLESQQAVFDAVVAADEAEPPRGGAAPEPPAAPAQGGGEAAAPADGGAAAPQQPPAAGEAGRDEGGDAASRAQRRRSAAQHAAIFGLVYGLLEEGDDRRWARCRLGCEPLQAGPGLGSPVCQATRLGRRPRLVRHPANEACTLRTHHTLQTQ